MKRQLNKFSSLILFSALTFLFGSCLKNNKYYNDFTNYKPSVELPRAAKGLNNPIGIKFSTDTTTSYPVYINVASVEKLNKPVTATLGIDKDYIAQYNATQNAAAIQAQHDYLADTSHHTSDAKYPYSYTPLEILPDSLYTVSSWDLTVPANERQAYADVVIKTNKLPPGHNYVLPFTITKASIDISSWNHLGLWLLSNIYSGVFTKYHVNIIKSGALLDDFDDPTMTLTTIDQHTVAQAGSIGDYFGGYTEFHFNADNSISVKATNGGTGDYGAKLLESSTNPATGEFYIKFSILGGKYVFTETYKR